jgi:hypothetical protein
MKNRMGSYYPYIIYGFSEWNNEYRMDPKWLATYFPEIQVFSRSVVLGVADRPCYGIVCAFDEKGKICIEDWQKRMVEDCYQVSKRDTKKSNVGFHAVIRGDSSFQQDIYDPEEYFGLLN